MEISNKTIMALLVATVVISLGGTYISLSAINSRLASIGLAPITGFAVVPNATATVTITSTSSIAFTQPTVAFGSGAVDIAGGFSNCTLSTTPDANSGCTGFTEVNNGFTIENDGNTNLSVELRSNVSAATFIGSSALFLWNVTVNETGSCVNKSGSARLAVQPNTSSGCGTGGAAAGDCGTIYEGVSTSNKNICPSLRYENANDALNIDINITIPYDAPTGAKLAGLIATGTVD